jgi:hypothetical protein
MAGHVLKSLGHNIRILEGSTSATLQSQAAGIRAGPEVLKFLENYVKDYPRVSYRYFRLICDSIDFPECMGQDAD